MSHSEQAQMPDSTFEGNPVVAVKSAKVGDFGGRSLSTLPGSALEFNPDQPAVASLRTWCVPAAASPNRRFHHGTHTVPAGLTHRGTPRP